MVWARLAKALALGPGPDQPSPTHGLGWAGPGQSRGEWADPLARHWRLGASPWEKQVARRSVVFGSTLGRIWLHAGSNLDWTDFGLTLDRMWVDFGSTLGRRWVDFESTLGQLWIDVGSTLDRLWVAFGSTLG